MLTLLLAAAQCLLAQSLPSDFLGLARDFSYDLTVANADRLLFSSQASGIQAFTFYSEGDLSDNIAFYLYSLWTWEPGQHWTGSGSDVRFFLVKTRSRLPVERYNITPIIEGTRNRTQTEENIMENLRRLCAPVHRLIEGLQQERAAPHGHDARLHPSIEHLTPEIPRLFRTLLSRALAGFEARIDESLPSLPAPRKRMVRVAPPSDFAYTWQETAANGQPETATLSYDRGAFRAIVHCAQPSFGALWQHGGPPAAA